MTNNNDANTINLEDDEETTHCNNKRKFRSGVWLHFIRPDPVPKINPRTHCKYCNHDYAFEPSSHGTRTLWDHLKRCSKNPHKELKEDKQQKKLCFQKGSDGPSLSAITYDKDTCRKALARMIVVDELAFRFVEKDGFRFFCSVMQPKFEVPSRITIARDIMTLYGEEKKKLKLMFSNASQQVCLTTDLWTSIQNVSYMVLTAHYIDDNWNLQKRILNFETISNHRGETIGKMIEACLIAWGIDKVLTITMDNASSNDVAINYMKRKICNWGKAVLDCELLHMRCYAHILNLVVTDGLKEYDSSIKVIRNAVRYVRSSPSRLNKFKQCVEQEKLEVSGSVCLDVPTRWNSTFLMLESALKFRMAFERMEDDSQYLGYFNESCIGPPVEMDWDAAEKFVQFLEIFYQVTNQFSGSLYVTSSLYLDHLCTLNTHITNSSKDGNEKLSKMAKGMKKKFDKYWTDLEKMNPLLFVAVVLDPRWKTIYVNWSIDDLYGAGLFSSTLKTRIETTLKRIYDQYCARDPNHVKGGSQNDTILDESVGGNIDDIRNRRLLKFKSECGNGGDCEGSELERYLKEGCESMDGPFDLLGWWKINSSKYRVLSKIAKDLLAIPVSTVSSESAFSTGGRVLDSFRSALTPKTVQALICAQDWLRSEPSQESLEFQCAFEDIEDIGNIEKVEKDFATILNLCTEHVD